MKSTMRKLPALVGPSKTNKFICRSASILFFTVLLSTPAQAQSRDAEKKYWVRAAGYAPKIDTSIKVSRTDQANASNGTEVDLESFVGLADNKVLPSFQIGAKLSKRWRLFGEYYRLGRTSRKKLDEEITFDGVTYEVGANVESEMTSSIYRAHFGYVFSRGKKHELGASLGLHLADFDVSLEGDGRLDDNTFNGDIRRVDVLAPLPTFGLFGNYSLTENWRLTGNADYFDLALGKYDGKLTRLQADIGYDVSDTVRLGGLYRFVDYQLGVKGSKVRSRIEYKYNGPGLFLEIGF